MFLSVTGDFDEHCQQFVSSFQICKDYNHLWLDSELILPDYVEKYYLDHPNPLGGLNRSEHKIAEEIDIRLDQNGIFVRWRGLRAVVRNESILIDTTITTTTTTTEIPISEDGAGWHSWRNIIVLVRAEEQATKSVGTKSREGKSDDR